MNDDVKSAPLGTLRDGKARSIYPLLSSTNTRPRPPRSPDLQSNRLGSFTPTFRMTSRFSNADAPLTFRQAVQTEDETSRPESNTFQA
jgi:hypothetical protein